jgi:CheY-like chemotaxis protein
MNGIDATTYIRNKLQISSEDLPIIALTAHVMGDEIQDCMKAGMDDYLSKPIKAATLVEKVSSWAKPLGVDSFDSLLCSPLPNILAGQANTYNTLDTARAEHYIQASHSTEMQSDNDLFVTNPFSGMTSENSPLIDVEMIAQFIQFIGKDKITDVFKSFELDLDQRITTMENSDFDIDVVRFETHALASTSGNLGMMKLSLYCREIMQGSETTISDVDLVKNKSKLLRDMAQTSCAAFNKYIDEE